MRWLNNLSSCLSKEILTYLVAKISIVIRLTIFLFTKTWLTILIARKTISFFENQQHLILQRDNQEKVIHEEQHEP